MPPVLSPIPDELRELALRLAPTDHTRPEALATAQGQEHLLTEPGFIAHQAQMLDLPCPSPGTAANLLDVAAAARAAIQQYGPSLPPAALAELERYADACALVGQAAAFQQHLLLAWLKRTMVEQPLADKLGVPVEHLDHAVNLLKLARKNSDGTPWEQGKAWR